MSRRDDPRDRLMMLADVSAGHRPFNVKRKTSSVRASPKMTMQDFVRMDPGYTPNIEHLVFPAPRRSNTTEAAPQSVAGKTRSRLAEMFALSKHLQQTGNVGRGSKPRTVNRSMDSAFDPRCSSRNVDPRRWIYNRPPPPPPPPQREELARRHREEPVRQAVQNQRIVVSQNADAVTATRTSVLHMRNSVDSWESTSSFEKVTPRIPGPNQRIYPTRAQLQQRQQIGHHITKHLSLTGSGAMMDTRPKAYPKWNSLSSEEPNARELSPVTWCDTEVDGVYLGKSGWVQVQHRSLDENKRLPKGPKNRTIKLVEYHSKSEPVTSPDDPPVFLAFEKEPSPPEIISPPPAFQDKAAAAASPRRFFGKGKFLQRGEAIDSDASPPQSPSPKKEWTTLAPMAPNLRRSPVASPDRRQEQRRMMGPQQHQARSLEGVGASSNTKRNRFLNQKYSESSSSTSSSSFQGFRSLDSCVTRPTMPRLSENTDSSVDLYGDADDEDNNSSSLNFSMQGHSLSLDYEQSKIFTKRTVTQRRSPVNEVKFSSSSTESVELPMKTSAGMTPPTRRSPSSRYTRSPQEDEAKVKRSRSLQLPEIKVPNYPQRGSPTSKDRRQSMAKPKSLESTLDEDIKREAEFVTEFLNGQRSKAAAQALLVQRLKGDKETKPVYYVGDTLKPGEIWQQKKSPETKKTFVKPPPIRRTTPVPTDFREKLNELKVPELEIRTSPLIPKNFGSNRDNPSNSSSSSDIWLTTSDRTVVKGLGVPSAKNSGQSTPLGGLTSPEDDGVTIKEMRPGSAPGNSESNNADELQQRSMSLPKSFASLGVEEEHRVGKPEVRPADLQTSSPRRKIDPPHTAPVTPLHDSRRPSVETAIKSSSTPLLLDKERKETPIKVRKWSDLENDLITSTSRDPSPRKNAATSPAESMLQKFKKSISQRFQKRASRELEYAPIARERYSLDASERDDRLAPIRKQMSLKEDQSEQRYKFGPLVWRSSKEKKRITKAARSLKCNSGDSGIQVEMAAGCAGCGAAGGEPYSDDESAASGGGSPPCDESDSPPEAAGRRRPRRRDRGLRPTSDLLNQILIDKFKAELRQRAYRSRQVRRTRSDLGGQPRAVPERRQMASPPRPPATSRPQSRRSPRPAALRRSLSQPIDIDKLSPLMRPKINQTGFASSRGSSALSEDEPDVCLRKAATLDSDSETSSVASLGDQRKRSLDTVAGQIDQSEISVLAEAVFDHVAIEAEELAFRAGDVVEVLETEHRDWWWGGANGKTGWFPAHFVRLRVSQEDTVEDCLEAMVTGKSVATHHRRRTSISLLSNDQVRSSVVRELVQTERDFVKVLRDVTEGYIVECRKRSDMFNNEQILTIFGNIEEILKFQMQFLHDLESKIDWENPYKSCIGECFLKHKQGFEMYSDYCNGHPAANVLLQELYQFNSYSKFFEACRLMRGLIEIPLDGYLLTPIQRICKYPLQLAELLKYTRKEHEDHDKIEEALETMRNVALFINERKRKVESLEKLALWQQRVEGWEGEDLIEDSSQLIHQGDVVRITSGMWTSNITVFLFDHQLVYCKKDLLKRNTYIYKGRICLDTSEIIDVHDGKDVHTGVTVRHGIKVYSCVRDKWLLFCCRSASEKDRWLRAFQEERRIVAREKEEGEIPLSTKQLARMTTHQKRPRKPRGKRYDHVGSTFQLNAGSNTLGRKMGLPWFTFGGAKRSARHRHHRGADSAS